jgi:hypothetical protein
LNFLIGEKSTGEVLRLRQKLQTQSDRAPIDSRIKKVCFWVFSIFIILLGILFYCKSGLWLTNSNRTLKVLGILGILAGGLLTGLVIGVGLIANLLISYAHLIESKLKNLNEKVEQSEGDLSKDEWEATWKEYELHIDLYRYYLDIGLKANLFFFFIAGGVLGIYLQKPSGIMKFSLLLPILLSFAFGGVFLHATFLWMRVSEVIREIRRELKLKKAPDINLMSLLLFVFGIVFFVIGTSIVLFAVFT